MAFAMDLAHPCGITGRGSAPGVDDRETSVVLPPVTGSYIMPIKAYLDGHQFDPETRRIMGVAFEMTRAALQLEDRNDPIIAIVANRIIELAKSGDCDANLLCERVLADLSRPPPRA